MIKKSLFGIFLVITTLCCLSSCDEHIDPYIDPYEVAMDNLCTPIWFDRYITNDNQDCLQELEFNYDFTGYDYRTYYYPSGRIERTEEIPFRWDWKRGYTNALYFDYIDGERIYLDDISFGYNTMTCIYDGLEEPVVFKASY